MRMLIDNFDFCSPSTILVIDDDGSVTELDLPETVDALRIGEANQ